MEIDSSIQVGRSPDGAIVRVLGRGTMRESPAFREFVGQCFQRAEGTVFVDLAECGYLDSTFLGCLIGLQKQCERGTSRMLIVADKSTRIRLFAASLLDRVLRFADACPPAVGDFIVLETPQLDATQLGLHVMQAHRRLAEVAGKDAATFRSIADRLAKELGD